MKLWVKNTILAVILVLIIAVPLLFMGGHEFGGSDDQASDAISELDESYEPWFESRSGSRRQVKSSHFSSVFRQVWAPVLSALYLAE